MLEAPLIRKIYAKPPSKDGVNCDWSLNIEAVLCCRHHHMAGDMTREQWIQFAKKCGATPFFMEDVGNDKAPAYEFDDEGNPVRVHGSVVRQLRRVPRRPVVQAEKQASGMKMIKCQFCSRPHPIYGQCPVCYGT